MTSSFFLAKLPRNLSSRDTLAFLICSYLICNTSFHLNEWLFVGGSKYVRRAFRHGRILEAKCQLWKIH